jgi:kynurenine formamidase
MIKNLIDLTHSLNEAIPTWTGTCGFESATQDDGPIRVNNFSFHLSSAGTHMDAPSHFNKRGMHIDQIPIEKLIVPLCVLEVSREADADFFLSAEHILQYEKKYGKILPGSFVAAHTGWDRYWSQPEKYRDADDDGSLHCPGFSQEAGHLLLERDIAGIGIDTLNPDGSNQEFPIHHAFLGAEKYIVENLTNLDQVPPSGAYVILLPIKIDGASEAPIRAIALEGI